MTALLPQEDYDNNERRCQMYESQLHGVGGEPYLKYLMEDRGLSLETIKHFRLGAVVNPDPQDHKFQYRICIPHMNLRGVTVLRFRAAPGQSGPKYLQPAGSRISVYNVAQLSEPLDYVAACEGEVDAMTLTQCGYPAVGFPGASTWRDHHAYLFDGYQRVFVLGDGDDAGEEFASKVARHVPNPRVITLPDNQDVNGLYVEQGIEAIHKLLGIKKGVGA